MNAASWASQPTGYRARGRRANSACAYALATTSGDCFRLLSERSSARPTTNHIKDRLRKCLHVTRIKLNIKRKIKLACDFVLGKCRHRNGLKQEHVRVVCLVLVLHVATPLSNSARQSEQFLASYAIASCLSVCQSVRPSGCL